MAAQPGYIDVGGLRFKLIDNGDNTVSLAENTIGAALSDALANPTTRSFGAALEVFNGTTWDRVRSATTSLATSYPTGAITVAPILVSNLGTQRPITTADNDSAGPNSLLAVAGLLFNGTSNDRPRNHVEATALASASRTTTQTVADVVTYNARALHVILDMTVVGTGSVTLTINGKDPTSGKYYPLLAGAAVTTNSTNVYKVGPALTAAANAVANDYLPRTIQFVVTANNANAATYSVGYILIA